MNQLRKAIAGVTLACIALCCACGDVNPNESAEDSARSAVLVWAREADDDILGPLGWPIERGRRTGSLKEVIGHLDALSDLIRTGRVTEIHAMASSESAVARWLAAHLLGHAEGDDAQAAATSLQALLYDDVPDVASQAGRALLRVSSEEPPSEELVRVLLSFRLPRYESHIATALVELAAYPGGNAALCAHLEPLFREALPPWFEAAPGYESVVDAALYAAQSCLDLPDSLLETLHNWTRKTGYERMALVIATHPSEATIEMAADFLSEHNAETALVGLSMSRVMGRDAARLAPIILRLLERKSTKRYVAVMAVKTYPHLVRGVEGDLAALLPALARLDRQVWAVASKSLRGSWPNKEHLQVQLAKLLGTASGDSRLLLEFLQKE